VLDAEWARFDRLVELFESAYVELECRRVTGRRWGDVLTEAARAAYGRQLREQGVYRDRAWQLAIAASGVSQPAGRVVDLSDTVCATFRYRLQLR
jgi:hypothetical protein